MIRVEFAAERHDSWAHEMLTNARWVKTLQQHGVPCAGRLVFSGLKRGTLHYTVDGAKSSFDFYEPGERYPSLPVEKTHTGKDHVVFMSGEHLTKFKEDEEL